MLVSYKWLQRYVDINVDAHKLGELLTMAGITVDLVHEPWADIHDILAGKIRRIDKHPDADKLQICQLDMGPDYHEFLNDEGLLQIVTGATNVAVGQTVPVAVHNSGVFGGKIKKSKLRGVESFGMLCSKEELNIEPNPEDVDGIWILPDEIAAGTDLKTELLLDDFVLELDLTPNRSDCLGIINVAREVSAILGTELHLPEISYQETAEKIEDLAKITVEDTELCPRYAGRLIKNIKWGQSPYWMQHFLQTAGMRPISNVVDVSNFVMLEQGQPMHTFDYDTLANHEIIVRRAHEGEKIVTLDETERTLCPDNLLICDGKRAVCVAGVMGGLNTEITSDTKNILLETAVFDHVSIRHTSKYLGLRSESSMRYEKGVNLANIDLVSRRAVQLLCELCGGEAVSGVIDTLEKESEQLVVKMRPARVNQVLGTDFAEADMVKAIESLRFPITKVAAEAEDAYGSAYLVTVPFYRPDITEEVDLIEEVVRLLGFDNVPTTLPDGAMSEGKLTERQRFGDQVIDAMVGLGANQIIAYSFLNPKEWDKLRLAESDQLRHNVEVLNPLNEEQKVMRTTLLPGLLKAIGKNQSRQNNDLLLFEKGSVFLPGEAELPDEPEHLGIAATGSFAGNWLGAGAEYDFFYIKGLWEALCQKFGVVPGASRLTDAPYLHPGRAAYLYAGDECLGYMGELHPLVAEQYDLKNRVVVLEIDLDKLYQQIVKLPQYVSLPKFPASSRDIAFVVKKDIPVAEIEAEIKKAGGKYLAEVYLFDVYEGERLGALNRSLAYSLTFRSPDRTLVDEEVNAAFDAILAALNDKFGAQLR